MARSLSTPSELVAEFLRCACLSYGDDDWPSKWKRAARLLARHPKIARVNLYTACVAGELELVQELLASKPTAASQRGGPQQWEPLLFVCYGRLPSLRAAESSVAIARELLAKGADPNAAFVMNERYRFSALTGAIGEGELGQPPHPRALELAKLLLAHGVNANDGQAIYNEMLVGDKTEWLELLFAHGLQHGDPINWEKGQGMSIVDFAFGYAVKRAQTKRLECLLRHGAHANARDFYNQRSAYENALLAGHEPIAELIVRHGGERVTLSGYDAFLAACTREDAEGARALLEGHPEYLENTDPLIAAVEARRPAVVRLMLELGMDPSRAAAHDKYAINAACYGDDSSLAIVELLLAHGANAGQVCYGGTPACWALSGARPDARGYEHRVEVARHLAERSRSAVDAALSGHVELLRALLASDPGLAREPDVHGDTPLHRLPDDDARGVQIMELLLGAGADPMATNLQGKTPAQALEARGLDELADVLRLRATELEA